MGNWLGRLGIWDWLLERRCPMCDRSTPNILCPNCERQLNVCKLANPEHYWQPPHPVFAWGSYGGKLKHAIAKLKYDNQPKLAQPLGYWLAQTWLASPLAQQLARQRSLLVVPLPMHADKRQQRGYDQADLIAQAFCHTTGLPLRSQGLIRQRQTEAMFGLSAIAREKNLKGAFELGRDLQKRSTAYSVLLLDDIHTTGTTARTAIQVLRSHNISVSGVIAVAKAGIREA